MNEFIKNIKKMKEIYKEFHSLYDVTDKTIDKINKIASSSIIKSDMLECIAAMINEAIEECIPKKIRVNEYFINFESDSYAVFHECIDFVMTIRKRSDPYEQQILYVIPYKYVDDNQIMFYDQQTKRSRICELNSNDIDVKALMEL